MSQNYIDNCFQMSHLIANGSSDLQDIENNFAVLKSSFAGASPPADCGDYSVIPGLFFYYTTKKQLGFRNAADSGWIYTFPGDTNQKIWVYRNDVVEGMIIVNITDKVLAIKGGSQAYNVNGGNTAGDWNFAHTHGPGSFTVNTYHRHGGEIVVSNGYYNYQTDWDNGHHTDYQGSTTQAVTGTSDSGNGSTWRPQAMVGILIKPNI